MKRKIDLLLDYMSKDDRINSIKLVSTFKNGVSKVEKEFIEIAAECYKGNEEFYKSLGYDTEEYKKNAWIAIIRNYEKQLNNKLK
ncbi:hypothetical protein M0Q97_05485 [Candidatus Dojkabacteria bacterium]|jgi:hypothetical protein|nr:hypothetical protein [Candidatus Dojkabacteria bacterium]